MTGRLLLLQADGGSRGNPGPAGYGTVVKDATTGEVLAERAASVGRATNNVAEYGGLIAGLTAAAEVDPDADIAVQMDSMLVVRQMRGEWKVKHPDMRPLAAQAAALVRRFGSVSFEWIPRERNGHADRLANEAMDAAAAGRTWAGPGAPAVAVPAPADLTGTRLLLLRHGQTAHSVDRRFSGRSDPPLTPYGEEQATAAAQRLSRAARRPVAIVSSPLQRAWSTAERAAEALGLPVHVDDRLRETDFGGWEGMTFADARRAGGDAFTAWLHDPALASPGGESFAETAVRALAVQADLVAAHPRAVVLVVTHTGPIKLLALSALGREAVTPTGLQRLHLDLAGLTTLDAYADGPTTLRSVNDTAHLSVEM